MDEGNLVHTTSYTMLTVCSCSGCCVLSGLDFEVSGGSMYLFASRASNHWKHDMGVLLWFINAKTHKRVPTPLFGRLVRCSDHGHLCETTVCMCTVLDVQIIHANSLQ